MFLLLSVEIESKTSMCQKDGCPSHSHRIEKNLIIRLFAWDAEKHQFKPHVSNKCVYTNYNNNTHPHCRAAGGQTDRSTHLSFRRLSVSLAQRRWLGGLYLVIVSKLSAPSHWAIYGSGDPSLSYSPQLSGSQHKLSCLQFHQNCHVSRKSFSFSITSFHIEPFNWTIANKL